MCDILCLEMYPQLNYLFVFCFDKGICLLEC